MNIKYLAIYALSAVALMSCSKVEPTGVLIGHTSVDDRVKQSITYYKDMESENTNDINISKLSYSFIVGSDSHLRSNMIRLEEFFQEAIDHGDILTAHCGDLAETQPEYYQLTENTVDTFKTRYPDKFRFFPVVGNHDVTRNGWAMFTKIFGSSTYSILVNCDDGTNTATDLFIFLDSANGTFGEYQIEVIESNILFAKEAVRNIFVFTHTNFFRPRKNAFSSTLPREELYYMLKTFHDWGVNTVFCGHIHAWDEREYGGVNYITLDAMSYEERPDYGDVIRCNVAEDGSVSYEHVHLK